MIYNQIPTEDLIKKTVEELQKRNIATVVVDTKEAALKELIASIPEGSSIMNGSSTTLNEIGFVEYAKQNKKWNNLHETILAEKDWQKQSEMRRHAIVDADYFLGGVNAITMEGQLMAVDATGSRVGAYPFAAKKLILVSGAQKIVPTINDAMNRIVEYVTPLEDERAQKAYGMHTSYGKWVVIEKEIDPTRTKLILIKEVLGF